MRKIVVLFLFLWNCSSAQIYRANWTGKSKTFEVQRSSDGKTFKTVFTTKNNTIDGTGATYYWRIKLDSSYSDTVWVCALVTITNAKLRFTNTSVVISWTAYTETNMNYYTIESINKITTVMKHGGSYMVTVPKIGATYQIIAHYKNNKTQILKTFNP